MLLGLGLTEILADAYLGVVVVVEVVGVVVVGDLALVLKRSCYLRHWAVRGRSRSRGRHHRNSGRGSQVVVIVVVVADLVVVVDEEVISKLGWWSW